MKVVRALSLVFLAALFLYAGIDKLFHYGGFVKALGGYVLVPDGLERHLALPVILAELLVGAGLLIKAWRAPASPFRGLAPSVNTPHGFSPSKGRVWWPYPIPKAR